MTRLRWRFKAVTCPLVGEMVVTANQVFIADVWASSPGMRRSGRAVR